MKKTIDITVTNSSDAMIQHREQYKRLLELILTSAVVTAPLIGSVLAIYLATQGIGGSAADWGVLLVMYLLSMIGVELGYHRYFTHRSFKAKPFVERLLGILGAMSMQGPVIWWSSVHRRHHLHADNQGDPHSPYGGVISSRLPLPVRFIYGHCGWLFNIESTRPQGWHNFVHDMYRNERAFKSHMQYWYWALAGIVLPGVADALLTQSLQGFALGILWGGLLRIFLAHHAFWSINSIGHMIGGRSFEARDNSRNNLVVALLTLGQGWHNNHHAFPTSAKVGLYWWQIDPGWWILCLAQHLGLISELKQPTAERIQKRAISN